MDHSEQEVEDEIRIIVEVAQEREVGPAMTAYAIMSYLREVGLQFLPLSDESVIRRRLERYVRVN